jgi:hypothetical protein
MVNDMSAVNQRKLLGDCLKHEGHEPAGIMAHIHVAFQWAIIPARGSNQVPSSSY